LSYKRDCRFKRCAKVCLISGCVDAFAFHTAYGRAARKRSNLTILEYLTIFALELIPHLYSFNPEFNMSWYKDLMEWEVDLESRLLGGGPDLKPAFATGKLQISIWVQKMRKSFFSYVVVRRFAICKHVKPIGRILSKTRTHQDLSLHTPIHKPCTPCFKKALYYCLMQLREGEMDRLEVLQHDMCGA
jgi:hypothetical protein